MIQILIELGGRDCKVAINTDAISYVQEEPSGHASIVMVGGGIVRTREQYAKVITAICQVGDLQMPKVVK